MRQIILHWSNCTIIRAYLEFCFRPRKEWLSCTEVCRESPNRLPSGSVNSSSATKDLFHLTVRLTVCKFCPGTLKKKTAKTTLTCQHPSRHQLKRLRKSLSLMIILFYQLFWQFWSQSLYCAFTSNYLAVLCLCNCIFWCKNQGKGSRAKQQKSKF